MGIILNFEKRCQVNLLKNKLSLALLIKSGQLMMSTIVELLTRKRPRSSFKIPSETLDPEMSSLMRPSMRSSTHSTRTALEPSRKERWLFSSSNSSEAEQHSLLMFQRILVSHLREEVNAIALDQVEQSVYT